MDTPSSQRRFTRSQARISGKEGTPAPSKPPVYSEAASIVKGGRRVLADIACNDSPIVGLVPGIAFTPSSNPKSAIGARSRKSLVIEEASPRSTPIGENVLRSQVQLLLQKVETDLNRGPALRTLCHINGFLDSPTRFAAPTPFNTPAAIDPDPSATPGTVATNGAPPSKLVETGVKLCEASEISPAPPFSSTDPVSCSTFCDVTNLVDSPSTRQIVIAESVCAEREPRATQIVPSDPKIIDAETTDLFLGKQITRTLQFDSPDKSAVNEKGRHFSEAIDGPSPPVRELEDDETSQWSVLVNVSSPVSKHDESDLLGEAHQETGNIESATTCSVYEHLQKTQEESNKLELLWSDQRRASPYGEGRTEEEEEEEAIYEDCFEEYFSDKEDEEEEYGDDHWENVECEDLCRSFRGMRVDEDGGKGLPQAEGKHIRFLYDSDGEEITEEKVVNKGIKERSPGAILLRGLPAPRGKHLRFCEKDDEFSPMR